MNAPKITNKSRHQAPSPSPSAREGAAHVSSTFSQHQTVPALGSEAELYPIANFVGTQIKEESPEIFEDGMLSDLPSFPLPTFSHLNHHIQSPVGHFEQQNEYDNGSSMSHLLEERYCSCHHCAPSPPPSPVASFLGFTSFNPAQEVEDKMESDFDYGRSSAQGSSPTLSAPLTVYEWGSCDSSVHSYLGM